MSDTEILSYEKLILCRENLQQICRHVVISSDILRSWKYVIRKMFFTDIDGWYFGSGIL